MILQIFWNKKFLLVKSNYLHYCDVYEHGKLEISVTTSLIMALVQVSNVMYLQFKGGMKKHLIFHNAC